MTKNQRVAPYTQTTLCDTRVILGRNQNLRDARCRQCCGNLAGRLRVVQGVVSPAIGRWPIPVYGFSLQHVGDIGFACLLAWIMFRTGMHTILDGILLALTLWLGFVAAVGGHMFAFRSFTLRFFATTAGSVLFALLIIGAVLGALIR